MRMFVALELDEATRAVLVEEQQRALSRVTSKSSLRLVDAEQIHLTLAFLGEVRSPTAEQAIDAMQRPFSGMQPFSIVVGGVGMFPARGTPRVLWLGLLSGVGEVMTLQTEVANRIRAIGIRLEERAFHPHVTIGRWRSARPSDRTCLERDASRHTTAGMTVDRVTLFESRLSSKGASHFPLAHAHLFPTP
jgi:2'-5' RNA ligase